jgi:DNA (cytosine-5)-methyltransferase 1
MEGEDYAFGAFDLCAAGFGAPHIRQRLYWVADTTRSGSGTGFRDIRSAEFGRFEFADSSSTVELADANNNGFQGCAVEAVLGTGWRQEGDAPGRSGGSLAERGELADTDGGDASAERQQRGGQQRQQQEDGRAVSLADTRDGQFSQPGWRPEIRNGYGSDRQNAPTGPVNGVWRNADWLLCRDGKWRPVESGTFPLAHGDRSRVGRLRAYGNAIVATQAEEFIGAYLDTEHLRLSEGIFA